jgi:hypothetical protein
MEGAPFKNEDDSEKTDKPRKKKTRPEAFGPFSAKSKAETTPLAGDEATKKWFEKLYNGDEKTETGESGVVEDDPEITTPDEDQFIAEQVVAVQSETDHQLVEAFRDKIIGEHLDPETAETETLEEFGITGESEVQAVAPLAAENSEITVIDLSPTNERIIHLEHQTIQAGIEYPAAGFSGQEKQAKPTLTSAGQAEQGRVNYENKSNNGTHPTSLVDYLVGRRQGRLKAEKRLGKVQKKMEQRVAAIQQDLLGKEARLRRVDTRQIQQRQKIVSLERPNRRLPYGPTSTSEQFIQRVAAPEARRLHVDAPPEHIGKVVVNAESAPRAGRPERQRLDRRIETLGHEELMAASADIKVENSNLRQIYETHLISEQGLRRLVETHHEGGNLKQALKQEIMEHEIDFERDPIMRDRLHLPTTATVSGNTSMASVIKKAIDDDRARDEVAVLRARAAYELSQEARQHSQRQLIDTGLVGTILLLTAAVVILLLSRG